MAFIFPKLIILGRPASGKSEIIDYLSKTPLYSRQEKFHMGKMLCIDDFPMLWTWFEEDAILEKEFNLPRLHTTPDGLFKDQYLWNLLIRRISLEYKKSVADKGENRSEFTRVIEFSRGTEHGGYREAFRHLSDELLKGAAILYVDVDFEESKRKNRKRFNPDKPHSILEHGLPDDKLEKLYKEVDWHEIANGSGTHININGHSVPYVVFNNMPSQTDDPGLLGPALEACLQKLWGIYNAS
jgi:hypothetical protein